jgi:hypothetical protein
MSFRGKETIVYRGNKVYIEVPLKCGFDIRIPTQEEVDNFIKEHEKGCPKLGVERLIYDEGGWMYDNRFCAVCDKLVGVI